MTVTYAGSPRYLWQGVHADTKPTSGLVNVNDLFFETDTGNTFIYNGASWASYPSGSSGGAGTVTSVSVVTANGVSGTVATPTTTPAITLTVSSIPVVSVSASPATGPLDNYAPTGYVGGTTNRLILTAASGGSTIDGILATGVTDGFQLLIQNASTTDVLIFPNLAAGSSAANQFSNQGSASVQIPANGAARVNYIVNKWVFA